MSETNPITPLSVTNPTEAEAVLRSFRRRRTRIVILGTVTLVLLGMLFAQGSLDLLPIISPSTPASTVTLYALSTLNFIAILLLSLVLVRNWLKLRQERQTRRLGSKFKTKMVIGSVAIAMLPVAMLFLFAYGLINRSLEKWFNLSAEQVLNDARTISASYMQREVRSLANTARGFSRELRLESGATPDMVPLEFSPAVRREFEFEVKNRELARVIVFDVNGTRLLTLGDAAIDTESNIVLAIRECLAGNTQSARFQSRGNEQFLYVTQPIKAGPPAWAGGGPTGKIAGGILVAQRVPEEVIQNLGNIDRHGQQRANLIAENRRIKLTYVYILGFVTLLIVFGATWIALYVARTVTAPIQALAEGTHAVAQGNLEHRVSCAADDELAVLVDSFNQMAGQLRTNRQQLEENAFQLRIANQALEDRRRYIETVLQNLFTGVLSLDTEHRLTTINQSGIELIGLDETALGKRFEDCLGASERTEFQRLLRRTRRLGQATVQIELHPPGVAGVHVAATGTTLRDDRGRPTGTVIVLEDLSPLIQAQRSAVWSEVARRMAHEIKNPLTPIQLSTERINRNIARHGIDSARVRQTIQECTAIIECEVATLQRMVEEFSRFAKLPDARPEPSSLNSVVIDTLRLYDERLGGIELETNFDAALPPLNLDREQIKRTLVNLIDNAVHAMEEIPANGNGVERRLTLATEYRPESEIVRLSVADTGPGIAPGDREKLFQPYFSKHKRGTGLGLAIVSHIVTDHNGRILIEDNQPHGARFIIELPAA